MTNTPFSNQVAIVSDFYLHMGYDYPDLLAGYDLGFPLAVAIIRGGVEEVTDLGKQWIEEAFIGICDEFDLDIYGEYDTLGDMVALANE